MEGQQRQTQKKRRRFPWIRAIVALVASLLLSVAVMLLILSIEQVIAAYWFVVIPVIFTIIGQLIPLYQWLFPIPTGEDEPPSSLPTPVEVKVSMMPSRAEQATQDEQVKQPATIWNGPYRQNPFFTGREELLKHLHDNLMSRKATALTQAICGLGGIGKTQTAVEYAYRYRDEYHEVLWVIAATRDTLISSFLDLACLLNLPQKDEQDHNIMVQAVRRWLVQHDQWLLIFDNADDLTLTEEFLPTGGKGHILLTTRAQALGTVANGIDVEKMDTEEGMLLLLHRARVLARGAPLAQASPADCAAAESIVKEMDGLPLALDQAGAYIEETHCGVSAYLVSYRQCQAELLKRRGGTGKEHPESVATTWSLSFEQVERLNPMAADLLRVCAFLAPDAIPEELLIKGASELGTHIQPLATDATRLNDAIGILLRYSLVECNTQERVLSIHRLVQVVLKGSMNKWLRCKWAERTVRAVNLTFPDVTDVTLWEQCKRYLPHALVCATLIEAYSFEFTEASHLLNETAYYLDSRAQYTQAEPLFKRALAIREQRLGKDHLDTATSLNNLARLYRDQGKYAEAEPLFKRALAIREQRLGKDHPDTATSLNNLARLYYRQGQYPAALPFYQRALTIREQQLGKDHPITAISLNALARLYQAQGKCAEAEPLFKCALAIREQRLGKDHPDTATSLNSLARLYYIQGKYAEAEPLYQRALRIWEQRVGPEHPDVAYPLNGLADLYRDQGKYADAEPLYQRALRIWEQQLGPEHPQMAYPLNGLANLYQAQGKYTQAEPLFKCALAIREQRLGKDHPDTATLRNDYAMLLQAIRGGTKTIFSGNTNETFMHETKKKRILHDFGE